MRLARALTGSFAAMVAVLAVLVPARPAGAHMLDEYLQATTVNVLPSGIEVSYTISVGVLLAPQVLDDIDTDGDEELSATEVSTYLAPIVGQLHLTVDGVPVPVAATRIDPVTYLSVQAGYGVIRVEADAPGVDTSAGRHSLRWRDDFTPTKARYTVRALAIGTDAVHVETQSTTDDQRQLDLTYTLTGATGSALSVPRADTSSSSRVERLGDVLADPSSSLTGIALALGLAAVLGALHALTPGHGKTLVAAYLVGDKGTARQAVLLGAVVTFTHTASVILIGLVTLFASQFIVPEVLVPTLEIGSGLLVVGLGLRLLRTRLAARRATATIGHDHDHDHEHAHDHHHGHVHAPALVGAGAPANDHTHDHGHHGHRHGDHDHHHHDHTVGHHHDNTVGHLHDHGDGKLHSHALPDEGITVRGLVAMGISGGIVPCPEALGIMVIAVGLQRIVFGLGLIVAFSFGLAAVLIAIGLLLVRSRALLERVGIGGGRATRWLPIVSAVVVTVLGLGMALRGISRLS